MSAKERSEAVSILMDEGLEEFAYLDYFGWPVSCMGLYVVEELSDKSVEDIEDALEGIRKKALRSLDSYDQDAMRVRLTESEAKDWLDSSEGSAFRSMAENKS